MMNIDENKLPPIGILVACGFFGFLAAGGIIGRIFFAASGQYPLDLSILLHLGILISCMGLWHRKRIGLIAFLLFIVAITISKSSVDEEPIRTFLHNGLLMIFLASGCTLPYWKHLK